MNKFQKLSQIIKDIEILEAAGKIKAAEILHNKFIKEAQVVAPNRNNYSPSSVNPQQQNYLQRNENSTTSVRDGVSTNFNFTGLQPEMVPVEIETSPGKKTIVMRPKNNIGNPYATRPSDPFSNIPGYNEFIKLRPQPYQVREFIEAKGTSTDKGSVIYNALANAQGGSKSLAKPAVTRTQVQPVADNPNAGPIVPNAMTINATPVAKKVQPTSAQMPTAPVRTSKPQISTNSPATTQAQPVAQDKFQNYYTEQSDTANFSQQQNSNPNTQQESNEQKLYMNSLNDIENAFKQQDRNTGEAIYNQTYNQFQNPKRKQFFGNQIQRLRSKYLKPGNNQGPKQM